MNLLKADSFSSKNNTAITNSYDEDEFIKLYGDSIESLFFPLMTDENRDLMWRHLRKVIKAAYWAGVDRGAQDPYC